MFYYLSFVRPPPCNCLTSDVKAIISVQIANDLRTELCGEPYDIYYFWVLLPSGDHTTLSKLTSWKPSVEYKLLEVPLPQRSKMTTGFRLVLGTSSPNAPLLRNLDGLDSSRISASLKGFGRDPFPVFSMPIELSKNGPKLNQGKGKKQEQIERHIRFSSTRCEGVQKFVVIREETSFDLDKKVWDSGLGLCSWLHSLLIEQISPPSSEVHTLQRLLTSEAPVNILELGSGTGLVSIWLAALLGDGQANQERNIKIVATDLPSAIPLINHNVKSNIHLFPSCTTVQGQVLDWEDESAIEKALFPGGIDFVIMADVTYNTDIFPALIQTLGRIRGATLGPSELVNDIEPDKAPPILLAYKERDPAERALFDLSNDIDVQFKLLSHIPGAGGNPIEVYVAL